VRTYRDLRLAPATSEMKGRWERCRTIAGTQLAKRYNDAASIAYRARIYLRRAYTDTLYQYIGEVEVDRVPIEGGQIRFTHHGKLERGHVEIVSPLDWERRGEIPVLHIVRARTNSRRKKPPAAGTAGISRVESMAIRDACTATAFQPRCS
jgi:hypothetical protein